MSTLSWKCARAQPTATQGAIDGVANWAVDAERSVHRGKSVDALAVDSKTSFASLIELRIKDMADVGRPLLRSKALCLEKLKSDIGREKLAALTRERLRCTVSITCSCSQRVLRLPPLGALNAVA